MTNMHNPESILQSPDFVPDVGTPQNETEIGSLDSSLDTHLRQLVLAANAIALVERNEANRTPGSVASHEATIARRFEVRKKEIADQATESRSALIDIALNSNTNGTLKLLTGIASKQEAHSQTITDSIDSAKTVATEARQTTNTASSAWMRRREPGTIPAKQEYSDIQLDAPKGLLDARRQKKAFRRVLKQQKGAAKHNSSVDALKHREEGELGPKGRLASEIVRSTQKADSLEAKLQGLHLNNEQSRIIRKMLVDTVGTIQLEHDKRIEKASRPISEAQRLVNEWPLGEMEPYASFSDAMAHLKQASQAIEKMPMADSARAELLHDWVITTLRLQQRRLFLNGSSASTEFTVGGGVALNTPSGRIELHNDGSISRADSAGTMTRKNPDGTNWEAPALRQTIPPELRELESASFDELGAAYTDVASNWERNRHNQDQATVEYVSNLYTQKVKAVVDHTERELEALNKLYEKKLSNSDKVIAQQIEKLQDQDDETAVETIKQAVNQEISQLRQERESIARRVESATKLFSQTTYQRAFIVATGETQPGAYIVTPGGKISVKNLSFLGIQGDWELNPDGSSKCHTPNGDTVAFSPSGIEI